MSLVDYVITRRSLIISDISSLISGLRRLAEWLLLCGWLVVVPTCPWDVVVSELLGAWLQAIVIASAVVGVNIFMSMILDSSSSFLVPLLLELIVAPLVLSSFICRLHDHTTLRLTLNPIGPGARRYLIETNHGLSSERIASNRVVAHIVCHIDVVGMVDGTYERLWHSLRWYSLRQMLPLHPLGIVMIALRNIRQVNPTLVHLARASTTATLFPTHHDHGVQISCIINPFNLLAIL